MIEGGTAPGRKYLSTTADGSKVDLYSRDDGSGRQRWIIQPVRSNPNDTSRPTYNFYILISGGVANGRKYLSSNSDGSRIELSAADDGSKRRLWALNVPAGKQFYIQSGVGTTLGYPFLGKSGASSTRLYPGNVVMPSLRWNILMSREQTYSISMPFNGVPGNRLILDTRGTISWEALWSDTGCGDCQKVMIENIGSGLVRIRNLRLGNAKQWSYLSLSPDGAGIRSVMGDDGSGRQRWKLSYAE
jgi:hypothetical protein